MGGISFSRAQSPVSTKNGHLSGAQPSVQATLILSVGGRIMSANPTFLEGTGYQDADIEGMSCERFFGANEQDVDINQPLWRAIGTGHIRHGIFTLMSKDGRRLGFQAMVHGVTNSAGETIRLVMTGSFRTGFHALAAQLADRPSANTSFHRRALRFGEKFKSDAANDLFMDGIRLGLQGS